MLSININKNDLAEYAWADMQIEIGDRLITGITSIQYAANRIVNEVYGSGSNPHTLNKGNKSFPVTIGLTQSEADALQDVVPLGQDITDLIIQINVTFAKISDPNNIVSHSIIDFHPEADPRGWNQGDTSMDVQLTGKARLILKRRL